MKQTVYLLLLSLALLTRPAMAQLGMGGACFPGKGKVAFGTVDSF